MTETTAPAPPGTLAAGRYRLGPLIGRGGMADVHLAVDRVLDREVAVKLFHVRPGTDAAHDRTEQITSEVRLSAWLDHPHLVRVFDAGVDEGPGGSRPWCVMQLVRGGTFADVTSPLPLVALAGAGRDLCRALAHLHERGVVHRDVKPSNVLRGEHGEVYLSDFGVARFIDGPPAATSVVSGTPAYLAPEQVHGGPSGPPGDVYAAGLVVLETLTGRREYSGEPIAAALARLLREPRIPDEIDPRLRRLLTRMLATDPATRPLAAEAADAFDRIAALPTRAAPPRRRRADRPAVAALATAAAGLAVAVATAVTVAASPSGEAGAVRLPSVEQSLPAGPATGGGTVVGGAATATGQGGSPVAGGQVSGDPVAGWAGTSGGAAGGPARGGVPGDGAAAGIPPGQDSPADGVDPGAGAGRGATPTTSPAPRAGGTATPPGHTTTTPPTGGTATGTPGPGTGSSTDTPATSGTPGGTQTTATTTEDGPPTDADPDHPGNEKPTPKGKGGTDAAPGAA